MAEQLYGVANLKKLLKFGFGTTEQIAEALKDGKFTWPEAFGFVDEISEIPGVVKAIPDVMKELSELSEEETTELHEFAKSEFDIPNDAVEEFVEDGLIWAIKTIALVKRFGGLKK